MPSIEVIVATYNRRRQLERCLAALQEHLQGDAQITVVDDCSDPPVGAWLDAGRLSLPLRLERTACNRGPAHARNLAARATNADLLAFVDDDVVVGEGWLQGHLDALDRAGPHGVSIGPLLPPRGWDATPWTRWEARTLEVEYDRMRRGAYRPSWRQFFTGNSVVQRDDFLAAGGFNESFTRAEDIELGYRLARLGCSFAFAPEAVGWHFAERSLTSWRAIPRQYARFDCEIDAAHPELRWQRTIGKELAGRHPATRLAGRLLAGVRPRRFGASTAIFLARAVNSLGGAPAAYPLLSLAFHLEYCAAAQEHLQLTLNQRSTARP